MFRVAAVVAVLTLTAASAFADTERTKLETFQAIQKEIYRYTYFTMFDDVKVVIEDAGVVRLTGSVTEPYKKNEIAKRAALVDGVNRVENAIEVLRVSRVDDELRLRFARSGDDSRKISVCARLQAVRRDLRTDSWRLPG